MMNLSERINYIYNFLILLKLSDLQKQSKNCAEFFLFLIQYSFLFKNNSTYEYGKLSETTKETRTIYTHLHRGDGKQTATTQYRSDYLGRMQHIIYPDGEKVVYGYDAGGQVTKVTGYHFNYEFNYVTDIAYDEYGQRVFIQYGNGVKTDYAYDKERRWLSLIKTINNNGKVFQNIEYNFDTVGNVLGYKNKCTTFETNQNYEYDSLYQLTKATGQTTYNPYYSVVPEYTSHYTQEFSFDELGLGNMTQKVSKENNSPAIKIGDGLNYSIEYVYDENFAHRLKRAGTRHFEYDDNGNVTLEYDNPNATASDEGEIQYSHKAVEVAEGVTAVDYGWGLYADDTKSSIKNARYKRQYIWNERNLLKASIDSSCTVNYVYGVDGQRSNKFTTATETLYFSKLWTVHTDSGNITHGGQVAKNIYLGENRIITKLNSGYNPSLSEELHRQYFYHIDHLGSATLITDKDGKEYQRIEYTSYGELWVEKTSNIGSDYLPYKFTGKEMDEETGLYYYGTRYLNPKLSRWMSADPALGEYFPVAPVNDDARRRNQNLPGMGGLFNTVNANLYHYAGNNPIKYTDPDGKQSTPPFLTFQDIWNFASKFDPNVKLCNLFNAASQGDAYAQSTLKYVFHEVSRDILKEISEKSSYTSLACLAIGQPEGTAVFSGISMIADGLLAIDDLVHGNYSSVGKEGLILVAGFVSSGILKNGIKSLSKSIQVTVGSTGKYYEIGHRGAIKSEKALRKLLTKDISDGYFGKEVIPNAPAIIEQVIKTYKKLTVENNE